MKEQSGLIADGIEFNYRDHPVLRGTYLRVEKGEICGLIGRNGCGKSTLMKVVAGELRQQSGIVVIDGRRFASPKQIERYRHLARLPQESMTPKGMRVQQLFRNLPESSQSILEDPVIEKIQKNRIGSISTGERRYLETMIVLSLGRNYILLDEPFTGLSPILIEQLSAHVRQAAAKGSGVLLSDHYSHYVLPLIDSGWVMQNGQCKALRDGEPFNKQLENLRYTSQHS